MTKIIEELKQFYFDRKYELVSTDIILKLLNNVINNHLISSFVGDDKARDFQNLPFFKLEFFSTTKVIYFIFYKFTKLCRAIYLFSTFEISISFFISKNTEIF